MKMKLKVDFSKFTETNGPLVVIDIMNLTGKLFMLEECVVGETHIIGYLTNGTQEDIDLLKKNNLLCEELPND